MPEEQLFKTAKTQTREDIADALIAAAEEIESGTVTLTETSESVAGGERIDEDETVEASIPAESTFEIELERLTDSETGVKRYELEYEIRWNEDPAESTETETE